VQGSTGDSGLCPVCGSPRRWTFFEARSVPVHIGIQWPTRAEAQACPRGDIVLARCESCAFTWNQAFDPKRTEYEGHYENALHYSGVFRNYAAALVDHLVDRYSLRGRDVIEIGCGDGEFLRQLCAAGSNRGTGFDPSLEREVRSAAVHLVPRVYGPEDSGVNADLVCCRQVLGHIERPVEFLREIRRTLGARRSVLFFEVPDIDFALERLSGWDIIYEHCSYFGPASLDRTFREAGFEVLDLRRWYGDIFIGIEARSPGATGSSGAPAPDGARAGRREVARSFAASWSAKIAGLERRLAELSASGLRAVLWGAGARAVTFVSVVRGAESIEYVVDLNPRKHGLHLAGGGQEIVPPAALLEIRPDVVILTNSIYRDEIAASLTEMGLFPEILIG
jgi:SAM-dependent methyltransferase